MEQNTSEILANISIKGHTIRLGLKKIIGHVSKYPLSEEGQRKTILSAAKIHLIYIISIKNESIVRDKHQVQCFRNQEEHFRSGLECSTRIQLLYAI